MAFDGFPLYPEQFFNPKQNLFFKGDFRFI